MNNNECTNNSRFCDSNSIITEISPQYIDNGSFKCLDRVTNISNDLCVDPSTFFSIVVAPNKC
jgi:hypothetical protein